MKMDYSFDNDNFNIELVKALNYKRIITEDYNSDYLYYKHPIKDFTITFVKGYSPRYHILNKTYFCETSEELTLKIREYEI